MTELGGVANQNLQWKHQQEHGWIGRAGSPAGLSMSGCSVMAAGTCCR